MTASTNAENPNAAGVVHAAGAQHEHPMLPIAVDGAKTPERISDTLAYYHFLMAIAPAIGTETVDETSRREGLLQKAGLSVADQAVFASTLGGVRADLEQLAEDRRRANEIDKAEDAAFYQQQEKALVDGARTALDAALSSEGTARLQSYIREHVKAFDQN